MKTPILNEHERYIYRMGSSQLGDIDLLEKRMAIAKLKQDFGKSWLIQKFIKPIVEYMAKQLRSDGDSKQ